MEICGEALGLGNISKFHAAQYEPRRSFARARGGQGHGDRARQSFGAALRRRAHSAEVEIPRSLFAEVQHLVQADELAVLVLLTAGAPQLSRQGVGTKWAEVLGCGNTVLEVLDKLREMSPQLVIEERQFRSVLVKIEDARRSTSTDRPRIVGGVRWTPKELACVHVDAAAASPG